MCLPQDPRFNGTATYDQGQVITTITQFYNFLTQLPYIAPADVLLPPPGGWSNINKDRFAALGKDDNVIELLAHLPYINMSGAEYMVAPYTYPIDYRGDKFQSALDKGVENAKINGWYIPSYHEFPPWVVPLTTGIIHGDYLMLDTSDAYPNHMECPKVLTRYADLGTITRYLLVTASYPPHYKAGDPREWRNACSDETKPVAEYLDGWKDCFRRLDWIGYPQETEPLVLLPGELPEESEEIQKVYYTHGWPDFFQREDCRQALMEWEKRRKERGQ